jgi:hypothetical protein
MGHQLCFLGCAMSSRYRPTLFIGLVLLAGCQAQPTAPTISQVQSPHARATQPGEYFSTDVLPLYEASRRSKDPDDFGDVLDRCTALSFALAALTQGISPHGGSRSASLAKRWETRGEDAVSVLIAVEMEKGASGDDAMAAVKARVDPLADTYVNHLNRARRHGDELLDPIVTADAEICGTLLLEVQRRLDSSEQT